MISGRAPSKDLKPKRPVATPQPGLLKRYLSRFDDGEVVRWAFRGLLLGAIGTLAIDLRDLSAENGWWNPAASAPPQTLEPVLPPSIDTDRPLPPDDPRRFVTADEEFLRRPMRFTLQPNGVLAAEGSIEPGTAALFAAEVEARGEYVQTVSLNSPGGALDDAMEMGRIVRARGFDTEVADGALCASSCPLLFAGGRSRTAGAKAAIGVHQFYAATREVTRAEQAMADAQMTTARISRHLREMGVDPALWLHALDTPPQALYYLSSDELTRYGLVIDAPALAKKDGT